jgi:hypothetical protein
MRAAVGFASHSGWAVMVAVAEGEPPAVLLRERVTLCPPGLPREAYHAAGQLAPGAAAAAIAAVEAAARDQSLEAVRQATVALARVGANLVAAAIRGEPGSRPPLAGILRVHALMHKYEGVLYREALAMGAEDAGLAVRRVPVPGGLDGGQFAEMGRSLGPPWGRDQKEAAALALYALAATG